MKCFSCKKIIINNAKFCEKCYNTYILDDKFNIVYEITCKLCNMKTTSIDIICVKCTNDLVQKLNYKSNKTNLDKALELYYSLDNSIFNIVMINLYNLVQKIQFKRFSKKVENFANNYPEIINSKNNKIKKIIKLKNRNIKRIKSSKETYKTNILRLDTLCFTLEKLGYYGFNINLLKSKMIELKNDDNDVIISDFIENIDDNDNDLLEIDDNKLIEAYQKDIEYLKDDIEEK